MSRRRKPRGSRAPAVLAVLLLGGMCGAWYYADRYHPEWLKVPARPAPQAPAPRVPARARSVAPTAPLRPKTVTGKVQFRRTVNGEAKLVPVTRPFPAKAPAQAALRDLLSGTPPAGCERPLPQGVKLRRVYIQSGTAVVDLSKELTANFRGGASTEKAAVYAVVDTLTSLPGVRRVQILVEGKRIDSLGGHLDLSEPLVAQ